MVNDLDAFVIMPFDDEFEDLYDDHLVPLFEDLEYNLNKADSLKSQRNILEDIIEGITSADLIVADLTGLNPNVFYELGIAHGTGIPTVLITKDLEELPFDLQAYNTIEYSLRYDEVEVLTDELSDVAESHKRGGISFGNPVSDYSEIEIDQASGIDADEQESEREENGENRKKKETVPERGILDYASEIDERLEDLQEDLEYISMKTTDLGSKILAHSRKIDGLENKQSSSARKRANSIAREAADDMDSYSEVISEKIAPIERNLGFIMDSQEKVIEFTDSSDPEQREVLERQQRELNNYLNESEAAIRSLSEFRQEVSNLTGLSRDITKSSKNLVIVLSELISILEEGSAKAERLISLINKDLHE